MVLEIHTCKIPNLILIDHHAIEIKRERERGGGGGIHPWIFKTPYNLGLNIEYVIAILLTSPFLLKGYKMPNFPFAFFTQDLKAHSSGTESDINKR